MCWHNPTLDAAMRDIVDSMQCPLVEIPREKIINYNGRFFLAPEAITEMVESPIYVFDAALAAP